MPANTPLGIPYPLGSDPVAQGATNIANIANWLDSRVRMAAGTVTVPVSAAVSGSVTVTFPSGRFTAAPQVVGSGNVAAFAWAIGTVTPTTTSVTIGVRHVDNVASTANPVVRWIAFQGW